MIHWTWLILAFVVGGNVGLFIMAAIACGRESDRMMEARYEDREREYVGGIALTNSTRWDGVSKHDHSSTATVGRQPTG